MIELTQKTTFDINLKIQTSIKLDSGKGYVVSNIETLTNKVSLEVVQEVHSLEELSDAIAIRLSSDSSIYEIFSAVKTWEKFFLSSVIYVDDITFSITDSVYSVTEDSIILEGDQTFELFLKKFGKHCECLRF